MEESHFSLSEMATVGYPLPYAHVIWVALLRLGALKINNKIKNRAGKKNRAGRGGTRL